jgi:hypothetical protein
LCCAMNAAECIKMQYQSDSTPSNSHEKTGWSAEWGNLGPFSDLHRKLPTHMGTADPLYLPHMQHMAAAAAHAMPSYRYKSFISAVKHSCNPPGRGFSSQLQRPFCCVIPSLQQLRLLQAHHISAHAQLRFTHCSTLKVAGCCSSRELRPTQNATAQLPEHGFEQGAFQTAPFQAQSTGPCGIADAAC